MNMRAAMQEISSENVRESTVGFSTKNAWAKWARRRYPNNGVKGLMAEFRLTEGEAKGVIYAQASQPTIDKLIDCGGFALGLEILAIRTGVSLERFIEQQAEEARVERARWEAAEHRLAGMEESLRARRSVYGGRDG